MDTGTADEVEEQGLDIVIAVMGYTDGLCALRGRHLGKPLITQFARCHLKADAVALRIATRAKMLHTEGDAMSVAEASAESLIAITGRSTELEVTVQRVYGIAQFLHRQQQCYAVCASAERHEERIAILLDGGSSEYLMYGREKGRHEE